MNVLYVSLFAPYDGVSHAGGKTLNYYINHLSDCNDSNVDIVTFCTKDEKEKLLNQKKRINVYPITYNWFLERLGIVYPKLFVNYSKTDFSLYLTHRLKTELRKLSENNKYDVIFLEWTHMVLHIKAVKRLFPSAKIIASEVDVAYQGVFRKCYNEKSLIKKSYKKKCAVNAKKREIDALMCADSIFVQSDKDMSLLTQEGISENKINIMVPFYHEIKGERKKTLSKNLIFWGQMSRMENEDAAIWFIQNVMPKISDLNCRFVVAGASPSDRLLRMQTDNVIVTGFVKDLSSLFYEADLFVCPLRFGAGIKVKVIEAMYTGIPVLTTEVGIEGIPCVNNRDYILCNDAEAYIKVIREYYNDNSKYLIIGEKGKNIIQQQFLLSKSFDEYYSVIKKLVCEGKE